VALDRRKGGERHSSPLRKRVGKREIEGGNNANKPSTHGVLTRGETVPRGGVYQLPIKRGVSEKEKSSACSKNSPGPKVGQIRRSVGEDWRTQGTTPLTFIKRLRKNELGKKRGGN